MLKATDSMNIKRQNYFKREKFILKLSGLSLANDECILYKIYSHIGFYIFNLPYPFLAFSGLLKHETGDRAEIIAFGTAISLGVLITTTAMSNRRKISRLLNKLEKEPFLPDTKRGGAVEETLIENWFLLKNKQSIAFYVTEIMYIGSGLVFAFVKIISSSDPGKWKLAFGPLTVLNVTQKSNFEISFFYQTVVMCLLTSKAFSIMAILYGTLLHFCVQLQILQKYLRKMNRSKYLLCTDLTNTNRLVSWKCLQSDLTRAVSYHLKILQIISDWEEIFSILIVFMYFGILGILCVLLYAVSRLPLHDLYALTLLVTAATVSILPLPICYWGEQVAHESEQVAKAAYEAYFVVADLRFQKGLIMIIRRSQRTVRLKAGNLVETSMVTFGWILRTSFSYFMIIRNLNMDQ